MKVREKKVDDLTPGDRAIGWGTVSRVLHVTPFNAPEAIRNTIRVEFSDARARFFERGRRVSVWSES